VVVVEPVTVVVVAQVDTWHQHLQHLQAHHIQSQWVVVVALVVVATIRH
jgi:hypothetical protein